MIIVYYIFTSDITYLNFNQCLLIRRFEICQVVWVRKIVVRNILWDGVGATVMLPTKSWKRTYTIYINGIYLTNTWFMPWLTSKRFHVNMKTPYTKHRWQERMAQTCRKWRWKGLSAGRRGLPQRCLLKMTVALWSSPGRWAPRGGEAGPGPPGPVAGHTPDIHYWWIVYTSNIPGIFHV